ncbi:hypothetical protein DB346_20735 [Verrucomicrobia bacterium LW23]|nr:hypothetical protein DB346_20735 [Verrucomicrobia bacterium LW23]
MNPCHWISTAREQWRRRPWLRVGLWAVALAVACIVYFAPLPGDLDNPSPGIIELLDVRGRPFARITVAEARATEPLALRDMGDWLPAVTVALEDHRYYSHGGLDWSSIAGSAVRNIAHGRIISGASTISQQVVKLASRREGRLFSSKIYEMCAAMRLERTWTKERILEEYLNRSHYGNRRVGPAAAARAYFDKTPRELTLAEAILLAGLPQAPTRYNPWRNPQAALVRYRRAVARLQKLGVVTDTEAARLVAHPPAIRKPEPPHPAPHFADALVADQVPTAGTTVIPTMLDLDVQPLAEGVVREWLARLAKAGARQAAAVILDNDTGGVSAMAGSPDYTAPDGMVNGCLLERPSGAMLYPLLYAEAIDRRLITAATQLPLISDATPAAEAAVPASGTAPAVQAPASGVFSREALRRALPQPALSVIRLAGADACVNRLRLWGLRGLDRTGEQTMEAQLEAGKTPVRLIDLASTCGGLARGGVRLPVRYRQTFAPGAAPARLPSGDGADPLDGTVTRTASGSSAAVPVAVPHAEHMIGRGSALLVLDMLARSPGRGTRAFTAERPYLPEFASISPGNGDAWAVAITGRHTVAVWVGNVDGSALVPETAFAAASAMAREVALRLLPRDGALQPPVAIAGVVPAVLQVRDVSLAHTGATPAGNGDVAGPRLWAGSPEPFGGDLSTMPLSQPAAPLRFQEYFLPGTGPEARSAPGSGHAVASAGVSRYGKGTWQPSVFGAQ